MEEGRVSWEIQPLALISLVLCSDQLITSQGLVCAGPVAVVPLATLLKLDKLCHLVGFYWHLIGSAYFGLSRIVLCLALNVPHARNPLALGRLWQVGTVPGSQCHLATILGVHCTQLPSFSSDCAMSVFLPSPLSLCCSYVGKTLNKLSYAKMLIKAIFILHRIATTCKVVSVPCKQKGLISTDMNNLRNVICHYLPGRLEFLQGARFNLGQISLKEEIPVSTASLWTYFLIE